MSLTAKQTQFARGILSGMTGSDAYRNAYDSKGDNTAIANKAYILSNNPEIVAYLAQERAKTASKAQWTREEMLETLKDIATNAEAPVDKTRAIAQASKMLGFDAPAKVELGMSDPLTSLVMEIRKRSTSA